MGLIALATTLFLIACTLAYYEELRAVARSLAGATGTLGSSAPLGVVAVPEGPSSMLDSLVRDLDSPDPRRFERAMERLPHYPPGALVRQLVPLLDGEPSHRRERIADLLLRHGGEDVLEPLHRYFLGRAGSFEAAAADAAKTAAPAPASPGSVERAHREVARRQGNVIFLNRRGPVFTARDLSGKSPRQARTPPPGPAKPPFDSPVLELDPVMRARAMADLPATGHPGAHDLLSKVVLADPEALVRAAAAAALTGGRHEPGVLDALCQATRDPDASVRWNACFALGKLGDTGAKAALRRAENDREGSVRLAARKALEGLGLDPPMPARIPSDGTLDG